MTPQAKIIEQLTLLRRLQEQRLRWYHSMENPGEDALKAATVANIVIETKAHIAALDKQIDAAGGFLEDAPGFGDPSLGLEEETSEESIEERLINAYEEIITDPNEPTLPEEVITLLENQQMALRQQVQ